MAFLVVTIPISVSAQVVKSDPASQAEAIGSEIERRVTQPPTTQDIIGEDIIINVGEYQPDIIRSGLLEEQGAVVYAVLSGTPSNPTVKIPKILDVDVISYDVTTTPPDLPVKIGRLTYIPPRNRVISYSNMGYIAVPIARIPKEKDVPHQIEINVNSRILFDVSAGLGASPTKIVLRQQDSDEWAKVREGKKYLDTYIHAEDIGANYATFNVYDGNMNPIAEGLKLKEGQKSKTLRRDRFYAPGQVFDKFTIYLKDIKNAGNNLDILIIKDGVPQSQTISEGESIYPGSGIVLERIDVSENEVIGYFKGPTGKGKKVKFPRRKLESGGEVTQADISTPSGRTDKICRLTTRDVDLSIVLDQVNTIITNKDDSKYQDSISYLRDCITSVPLSSITGDAMTKEQAKAIQKFLIELETITASHLNPTISNLHTEVVVVFNEFMEKYSAAYPSATATTGITTIGGSAEEKYKLAIEQYDHVVSTLSTKFQSFEYNGRGETQIGDFLAQFDKAILQHTKLRDIGTALREYRKLLEIYDAYEPEKKAEADRTGTSRYEIENIISVLETLLQTSSDKRLVGQMELVDTDGSVVSVIIKSATLTHFATDKKISIARLEIEKPNGNSEGVTKSETDTINPGVFEYENSDWRLKEIGDDYIIVSNSHSTLRDIRINKDNQKGVSVKVGNEDDSREMTIKLISTELHKEAHIVVSPNIEKAFSSANFNLHLPIEKRAIDLPLFSDSIEEEINKTEKLIKKLDKILEKVGKVHDSWKKFCLVVYAGIAVLNFVKAIVGAGGGRAKQKGTDIFWEQNKEKCENEKLTLDECVFKYQDEYDEIISNTENAYDYADDRKENTQYEGFDVTEKNKEEMQNLAYLEKQVELNPEDKSLRKEYIAALRATQEREDYARFVSETGTTVGSLTSEQKQNISREMALRRAARVATLTSEIENDATIVPTERQEMVNYLNMVEMGKSYHIRPSRDKVYLGDLTRIGALNPAQRTTIKEMEIESEIRRIQQNDPSKSDTDARNEATAEIERIMEDDDYIYTPPTGPHVFFENNNKDQESENGEFTLTEEQVNQRIPHQASVTYYRDGANEGRVHRITIDAEHYAEVEYSAGGRISEINVFSRLEPNSPIRADNTESLDGELRNVIKNAERERNSGLARDLRKVEGCISQINRAKSQGRDSILCNSVNYAVTNDPSIKGPACVNFYSPWECRLLFNACDPVLCPASRCDLNGAWRVKDDNVVQTGIIGSSILCLHNFGIPGTDIGFEGGQVIMPICITGIYAGLQNLRTVLMEYRDCLKRAMVDGESVGVCDLIRSYYICDILWKEAVAILNLKGGLLGAMVGLFKDEDEGSEYTDFDANLDQATGGLQYFTQSYAKNTFAQFSGGSLPEIGGEICKSAIFGKVPGIGSFTDQLLRPESPPQFTAILDRVPYTDIPDKPQAEYQVYYRIYAGANEPITFSVYLKYGGIQGQSQLPVVPIVQNKPLALDAFDAETRNFVAPDGYNQVCVAYSSRTYGVREECGFGKTSSGFAIEYAANRIAEREATGGGIMTAEDCAPSGSRFSSPGSNYISNTGRIIAGGFSSGLLETGIVRVCSGVVPGKENEWRQVGECWEEKNKGGRNLGYCWLHMPSAEKIVTEYSVYKEKDLTNFRGEIQNLTGAAIEGMAEYASSMGKGFGYLTNEELAEAETRLEEKKRNITTNLSASLPGQWQEVVNIYLDLIDSPIASTSKVLEYRIELANWYRQWGDHLSGALLSTPTPIPIWLNNLIILDYNLLENSTKYIVFHKMILPSLSTSFRNSQAFIFYSETDLASLSPSKANYLTNIIRTNNYLIFNPLNLIPGREIKRGINDIIASGYIDIENPAPFS